MRAAIILLVFGCAAAKPAAIANTKQTPPRMPPSALDAFAFIDGCWSFRDPDTGYAASICWSRRFDAWEGRFVSRGSAGLRTETLYWIQPESADRFVLRTYSNSCETSPGTPCPGGPTPIAKRYGSAPVTGHCSDGVAPAACPEARTRVRFGRGGDALWLAVSPTRDALFLADAHSMHRLERRR